MKMSSIPLVMVLVLLLQACIPGGGVTPAPATGTLPAAVTPPAAATQPASTSTTAPALPTDTVPPVPTETAVSSATAVPSAPAVPSAAATPSATAAPTAANPTPGFGRPEAVLIQQPGPGSRVTSPVRVAGMADPTFEQSLAVTILSAEGTPLATTSTQIGADVGQRGPFSVEVPFTITQEQQGFIQVYTISAKDGKVTHLASVGVTLLPGGTASITTAPDHPEQIIILQPGTGARISGGVVHVEGFGLASFEQSLLVEVLDENGAVIASAPVTITAPDVGQPGPFQVDIPYSISGSRANAGRVQVRDISPAHGGNSHLASVEVQLEP